MQFRQVLNLTQLSYCTLYNCQQNYLQSSHTNVDVAPSFK